MSGNSEFPLNEGMINLPKFYNFNLQLCHSRQRADCLLPDFKKYTVKFYII